MSMTPEFNGDLCKMAYERFRDGKGSLSGFPGLIKEIIQEKAWERREHNGKIYELPSLLALVTEKPLAGWGQDPAAVERLLRDDPEALAMWRGEVVKTHGGDRKSEQAKIKNDNISLDKESSHGTGKSYTLSRLKRARPELFQAVCNGELTANAAMIQAGLRKSVVSVGANPVSAAKTLKKKFGLDYVKELIKELSKQ
jgi:hypothetical protein